MLLFKNVDFFGKECINECPRDAGVDIMDIVTGCIKAFFSEMYNHTIG